MNLQDIYDYGSSAARNLAGQIPFSGRARLAAEGVRDYASNVYAGAMDVAGSVQRGGSEVAGMFRGNFMGAMLPVGAAIGGYVDYRMSRNEGKNQLHSLGRAAGMTYLYNMFPAWAIGGSIGAGLIKGGAQLGMALAMQSQNQQLYTTPPVTQYAQEAQQKALADMQMAYTQIGTVSYSNSDPTFGNEGALLHNRNRRTYG